jgi:hypothetical protein
MVEVEAQPGWDDNQDELGEYAASRLLPLVYDELSKLAAARKLAAQRMAQEQPGQML